MHTPVVDKAPSTIWIVHPLFVTVVSDIICAINFVGPVITPFCVIIERGVVIALLVFANVYNLGMRSVVGHNWVRKACIRHKYDLACRQHENEA
tara:strand:+ start:2439 stop:2720 length:282 start_codon:yes stop_codon:yes gene_type:complete